jgi:hypothetical protein
VIKIFCDACGKEIEGKGFHLSEETVLKGTQKVTVVITVFRHPEQMPDICPACAREAVAQVMGLSKL